MGFPSKLNENSPSGRGDVARNASGGLRILESNPYCLRTCWMASGGVALAALAAERQPRIASEMIPRIWFIVFAQRDCRKSPKLQKGTVLRGYQSAGPPLNWPLNANSRALIFSRFCDEGFSDSLNATREAPSKPASNCWALPDRRRAVPRLPRRACSPTSHLHSLHWCTERVLRDREDVDPRLYS